MIVFHKDSASALKVFDVKRDEQGYPHFLVYYKNQWRYISAKHFTPMDRW